jgi:hypothetical protein
MKELKQIIDVLGFRDSEELYATYGDDVEAMTSCINMVHKANEGVRAYPSRVIERRLQIMGAFDSIGWEALGIRGIYYRVVSIYGLPKDDATYKKVQQECLNMRRDGTLDYKYITDGARHTYGSETYENEADFLENINYAYRRDLWSDSRYRVEVAVEKDAMRSILGRVTAKYGVSLTPTSGFNSETSWYEMAEKFKRAGDDKIPVLLMMTDRDTAGLNMVGAAKKAFRRFGVHVVIKRVGLTEAHIEGYGLLTRKDKINPNMSACDLDALRPDDAREILEVSINAYVNEEAFKFNKELERQGRFNILEAAKGVEIAS